jgi:CAAX protease family protein
VLITLVAHATQGSLRIGGLWSAGADLAQANLLFGVVASAVAIGLVVFDRKAWRGPAPTEATTQPVMSSGPPREARPAAPA